jgi:hypothetical protein
LHPFLPGDPVTNRICGRCGALAVPTSQLTVVMLGIPTVAGTRTELTCTGCRRRIRIASMPATVMVCLAPAICLALLILAPIMWPVLLGLAALTSLPVALLVHARTANPPVVDGRR